MHAVGEPAQSFTKKVNGKVTLLFVAKEGNHQGKILSAMVTGAKNMTKWGQW
ncbi:MULTISPECIES: hypothetical protein [Streptomyces]|uniref:hypothetical protein n=1 Tax=Streptomyces TaxID=1883 RepID=UPI000B11BE95|nr:MULTISPECIES: hypothetical protein [Streptomyces]